MELDTALLEFSASLATLGLPTTLASAADLDLIMSAISTSLLPSLKLYEYYVVDVAKESKAFEAAWSASSPLSSADGIHVDSDVKALSGKALGSAFADACLPRSWSHLGSRFQPSVTVPAAVAFVSTLLDKSPDATSAGEATTTFRALVDLVNLPRYELFNSDLAAILDNTRNRIQYTRLDAHGPRFGPVTPKSVLFCVRSVAGGPDSLSCFPDLPWSRASLLASPPRPAQRRKILAPSLSPTTAGSGTRTLSRTLPPPTLGRTFVGT